MMALKDPSQQKLLDQLRHKSPTRKFRNQPISCDGEHWDSLAECARYIVLKKMEENGEVCELKIKPVFVFKSGIKFVPDFSYRIPKKLPGEKKKVVIEDVKSPVTARWRPFKIKCALLKNEYKLNVSVVFMDADAAGAIIKGYISTPEYKARQAEWEKQ